MNESEVVRANLDKDPSEVAEMFDRVARRYDLANDIMSLGQDRVWRRAVKLALRPQPGERILDLAAGTGTSTMSLMSTGAEVVACDISEGMLAEARRRYPEIQTVVGDATELPFADASFEAVAISFGLRNVVDVDKALREMARVTKPGGRLVICEFSRPAHQPLRAIYNFYLATVLRSMARLVSSNTAAYDYLAESILDWPEQTALGRILLRNGWSQVAYRNYSGGIVALHRAIRE